MKDYEDFLRENLKFSDDLIFDHRQDSITVINNLDRSYIINRDDNALITYIVIKNYINDSILVAYSVDFKSEKEIKNYEFLFSKSKTFNINPNNNKNIIANDIVSLGGFYEKN